MSWVGRFLKQPDHRYRNFQIVYTILTLNFLIPAVSYYIDPGGAMDNAYRIGELFGSERPATEDSYLWWILGAGNVTTLGFMCLLLQINLRYFFPVLPALVVLKGLSSIGYLGVFALGVANPTFLAIWLFDGLTVAVMLWFAIRARRSIDRNPEGLIPKPVSPDRLRRLGVRERRRVRVMAEALVPDGVSERLSTGAGTEDVVASVQEQLKAAPLGAALGLRIALGAVYLSPFLVVYRLRTLRGLKQGIRSRYLGALERHRLFVVRQIFLAVKGIVLIAYMGQPEVRSALGAYRTAEKPARSS